MIKNFFDSLNISYKENISLKNYNTYRVNTICKFLVFPKTIEELKSILSYIKENEEIVKIEAKKYQKEYGFIKQVGRLAFLIHFIVVNR